MRDALPSRRLASAVDSVQVSISLDPYLSVKALAGYSGLSVRTLRNLLIDPHHPLPHFRIGAKILVQRSGFDRWIAAFRQSGDPDLDQIVDNAVRELKGDGCDSGSYPRQRRPARDPGLDLKTKKGRPDQAGSRAAQTSAK